MQQQQGEVKVVYPDKGKKPGKKNPLDLRSDSLACVPGLFYRGTSRISRPAGRAYMSCSVPGMYTYSTGAQVRSLNLNCVHISSVTGGDNLTDICNVYV